jgi:hypothetical protein
MQSRGLFCTGERVATSAAQTNRSAGISDACMRRERRVAWSRDMTATAHNTVRCCMAWPLAVAARLFNCFTGSNWRSRTRLALRVLTPNRERSLGQCTCRRAVRCTAGPRTGSVNSFAPGLGHGGGAHVSGSTDRNRATAAGHRRGLSARRARTTDGRRHAGVKDMLSPRRIPCALRGGSGRLRDGTDGCRSRGTYDRNDHSDHAAASDHRAGAYARLVRCHGRRACPRKGGALRWPTWLGRLVASADRCQPIARRYRSRC